MTESAELERVQRLAQIWLTNPKQDVAMASALVLFEALDLFFATRMGAREVAEMHYRIADRWAVAGTGDAHAG